MMRLIISLLLAKIFIFSQSKFDKKNNFSNVDEFSLFQFMKPWIQNH